jgi:hypothetical protein
VPLPTKRFADANRWRAYRARDTVGWIVSYVVDELAVFAQARRARPAHMRGSNQQLRKRSFHGGAGVAIITPSTTEDLHERRRDQRSQPVPR